MSYLEVRRHTLRVKPGQHLSQAGVTLARRVGAGMGPFTQVVTSPIPRAYETAIALGFAVDRVLEELSTFGDAVNTAVVWDAGFAAWAAAIRSTAVVAQFAAEQAALWRALMAEVPADGAVLIITHGGIIEAGAVACLPGADHAAWGPVCDYCEGVRLRWNGAAFTDAALLRVGAA